jgi:hypothetical protein
MKEGGKGRMKEVEELLASLAGAETNWVHQ